MVEKTNHTKILLWISIPVFVILIGLSALQWYKLDENISKAKLENRENYKKILNTKNAGYFQIEVKNFDKKNVIIDKEEVRKISNHIDFLTQEVKKETNRAESIIDKDLDRLNLYMAVGIGFMTLLGIFVPILINVLSVQDLRDQQSQLSDSFKQLVEKQPNIEKAITDSETAISNANIAIEKSKGLDDLVTKIESIEGKTKKAIPDICNLLLQNAVGRFFNIGPMVLTKGSREKNYNEFILLLSVVKNAFEYCSEDSDHTVSNLNFKNTLDDFIFSLEAERFQLHPAFNKRIDYNEFQELMVDLMRLKESSEEDKKERYQKVIDKIEAIIVIFKNKHA